MHQRTPCATLVRRVSNLSPPEVGVSLMLCTFLNGRVLRSCRSARLFGLLLGETAVCIDVISVKEFLDVLAQALDVQAGHPRI